LGCPDWPTCDGQSFVPLPGSEHAGWQAAIEFGNRLLTFVVLAAVIAVWIQVRRTRPHSRQVEFLAWFLPAGVAFQAILGGITVLTGLHPLTVAAHFLASMALIFAAVLLHERVSKPSGGEPIGTGLRHATTALAAVAIAVMVLGTIVTGAGPHGGDVTAPRLPVDIRIAALAHADAVWLLVGLTIALVVVTWRHSSRRLRVALRVLLAIEIVQGALGYAQYALGIPNTLVALHILGAALMWTAASAVWARAHPVANPELKSTTPVEPVSP